MSVDWGDLPATGTVLSRAGRRQRRCSTDEAGESRGREGRQGGECVTLSDPKTTRAQVSAKAMPTGETTLDEWVERDVWTERMLETLRRGGPEGGKWYSLQDKVFAEKTLRAAYRRVARNHGAPGVDGMTVKAFGNRLDEEIARLRKAWLVGTYHPQAIRRVWIPKPGTDEKRPLGIPTVRDRVVQAALVSVLEPIFETTFSEHSHGFRPGRGARGALTAVLNHLQSGKIRVVDADLKGYFDSIPHERLLAAVGRKVTDGRVLELIVMFLKAGVLEGMELAEPEAGTPQGGVISPLLANIYLNDLDHQMAGSGIAMERYADDFVILCRSQEEAESALTRVKAWTEQVGLILHPTKTRIVDMGELDAHIDFLGYRLQRHKNRKGQERIIRLVRPKSLDRMREKIRSLTPRNSGDSLPDQIGRLNQTLRGWFEYYRSVTQSTHAALDKLIRRRLRAMLCKRVGRDMPTWGRGWHQKQWPKSFFAELGLFSLESAHAQFIQSHR